MKQQPVKAFSWMQTEMRIDFRSKLITKYTKVEVIEISFIIIISQPFFVLGQAVRYVEKEIGMKLQEGYKEKKGQQFDSPQQHGKMNDESHILHHQGDNTSTRSNRLSEEETHIVEGENDGRTSVEEEFLQFCESTSQKKSSPGSEYGRSLLFEAIEDLEQSSPEILSKKITKLKRKGATHSQRLAKARENSDEIQQNKRNATILLRPAPLENLQSLGDLNKYYITEKCDGINCYWDGTTLYTSSFNKCNPYQEFLEDFPKQKLIGQLVAKNGSTTCQQLRSLASTPCDKWLDLVFIVEDLHDEKLPFKERLKIMKEIKESPYIQVSPYKVFEEEHGLDGFIQSARSKNIKKVCLKHPEGLYRGGGSGGFYSYSVN